jgi:hypothetical protein
MSRLPGGQPADGPPRPLRQAAGRARFQSLLRYDIEDDPGRGVALYEAVVAQDTSRLTADEWLDRLDAIERAKARLAALEAETIAGFDDSLHGVSADLGHRHPEPGDRTATPGERRWIAGDLRSVADELALILNLRKGHATSRIHTSCELVRNFRATLHALREGWLTERAAFTTVTELSVLNDIDDIHAAEAAILTWARTHPLAEIKQACQREVAHRSPAASDKRHQRAHDERSVRMFPDGDGRATLVHDHDAVDAAAVMNSLSRSAARYRRKGDPRTTKQLCSDIALDRLLRHTKRRNSTPTTAHTTGHEPADSTGYDSTVQEPAGDTESGVGIGGESVSEDQQTTNGLHGDPSRDPFDGDAPTADEPPDHRDYEPFDDSGREPVDELGNESFGDQPTADHLDGDLTPDLDFVDEATVGAEATVVIHATGAEVAALINREVATGGEADHHGPIPQSSLRKHLIKAFAHTLLPNLPTTPNSPRPGAATRRARTTGGDPGSADRAHSTHTDADTTAGSAPAGASATPGATRAGGSRIELRITDQPPPSDPDRYTPSAALDRFVRLRDLTCQFPGCNRPAEFTDLDHRIPFAAGGRTTAANLWCLCRHHHRLKHEGGWDIDPNPDGTWTWISPTGRRYRNNPTNYDPLPNPTDQVAPPGPTDKGIPPDTTGPPQPSADGPQPEQT